MGFGAICHSYGLDICRSCNNLIAPKLFGLINRGIRHYPYSPYRVVIIAWAVQRLECGERSWRAIDFGICGDRVVVYRWSWSRSSQSESSSWRLMPPNSWVAPAELRTHMDGPDWHGPGEGPESWGSKWMAPDWCGLRAEADAFFLGPMLGLLACWVF